MKLLLTSVVGLEPIVLEELKDFGLKGKVIRRARIIVNGSKEDVVRLNLLSRSVERVIALLSVERVESLEDIYNVVKSVDFSDWFSPDMAFAVRSERMGKHPFTSIDIARVAGQAVIDGFIEETGKRPPVNLNNPDVVVRVDLDEDTLFVGIDTTGDDALHKRGWRRYIHPANLNPTIAYALVRLAGWKTNQILLDPMCGGGTIPIEAALWATGRPHSTWRHFAFEKLPMFDNVRVNVRERMIDYEIYGSDLYKKHVEGAKVNAESAGVDIDFFQWDARRVHELPFTPDVVVTNPPYGLRIANPRVVDALYDAFAESVAKANIERVVAMSARWKELAEALEHAGYRVEKVLGILYGKLPVGVIRAER